MQSKKPILGVISLGLLLGAGILFQDTSKPASPAVKAAEESIPMSDQQIKLAGITFANAGAASIATVVRLPGEVKLNEDRTAHVVPRLPGVAESVSVDLGQRVKKGQVLAVISSPELADLRSALLAAEKRLTLAKITFEREELLWRERISAERDYLQARQAFSEAEIQVQSARAKLTALGADVSEGALNRYVLRAPFDSVVVEKHITQGEAVKEDANVFLLSDLSSVWVEVVVAAGDIEAVRVGAAVEIKSGSTGSSAIGKVSYVGNLLGEQTRTAKARVVIDNPGTAWRPGLFVDVSLARGKKEVAVAVQAEAIHTLEGKPVVFTQAANGFKANAVRTGISDGRLVEILEGLPPGAAYAAAGSFVIKAQQGIASAEHGH